MKTSRFIQYILIVLIFSGCKKFIDVNNNPNSPTSVSEKLLLAPIEVQIAGEPAAINVNHIMQNIALNQAAPNTGTYLFTNSSFDGTWSTLYATCIKNLKLLQDMAVENKNPNYSGIAKVLTAYCFAMLTDYFGDVPLTDALQGLGKQFPAYDKQEDVYKRIQSLLDEAIADFNQNTGLKPGSDDFFYAGDISKWKKLSYTLKARYHMRLSKIYGASTQADLVLADLANAMTSNADDLKFTYPGTAGYYNRWYNAMLPVETVSFASTLIDSLVSRSDPRLSILVAPAVSDGAYRGRKIGISFSSLPNLNSFSVVGSFYGAQASPVFLVNYSEVLFLKAEATLIKSGFAAAQPVYQDAIKAHMTKLNVSASAVTNYLSSRGTLTAANALQRIMEEKTIANFLSVENYNDWRRTGFPELSLVANASLPQIPRRFFYPQSELNTNPQAIHSAKLTDRVWWDKP
jgi:hypothetical protein